MAQRLPSRATGRFRLAIDAAALSKRAGAAAAAWSIAAQRFFKRAAPPTQAEANGLYLLMELGDNDLLDLFLGRQKPTANLDRPEVHQVLAAVRAQGTRPETSLSSATFSRTSS
jgi:hypothetical protein